MQLVLTATVQKFVARAVVARLPFIFGLLILGTASPSTISAAAATMNPQDGTSASVSTISQPNNTSSSRRLYGVVGQGGLGESIDATLLKQQYAAGIRAHLVELGWNVLQPTGPGDWNSAVATVFQSKIDAFVATGPDTVLYLDLGLHYTPTWVASTDPLRDQYGTIWDAAHQGGAPNVYWSPTVRQYVASYIRQVFSRLNFHGRMAIVRVGTYVAELDFPNANNHPGQPVSFWAYDQTAQAQSPVPGWTPGQSSPNDEARRFYLWYVDTLTNTFDFILAEIRQYYAGSVAPVTPGAGMWDPLVNTLVANNLFVPGWNLVGTGNYWQRIYGTLPPASANVVNWHSSLGDASGVNESSTYPWDWSSAHQQTYLAHQSGRRIYGENPGSNAFAASAAADPRTTMQWDFQALRTWGFSGLMWVRQADMTNPANASLRQYASMIAQYR